MEFKSIEDETYGFFKYYYDEDLKEAWAFNLVDPEATAMRLAEFTDVGSQEEAEKLLDEAVDKYKSR